MMNSRLSSCLPVSPLAPVGATCCGKGVVFVGGIKEAISMRPLRKGCMEMAIIHLLLK